MNRTSADDEDVVDALYGRRAYALDPGSGPPRPFRQPDGLWRGSRGWRNQQVTALLTFGHELRPWSVSVVAPSLWLNPHATDALSPGLPWRRLELDADANRLVTKPGSFEPGRAFQLPDVASFSDPSDWPGKPFANRFD